MADESVYVLAKQLEGEVSRILAAALAADLLNPTDEHEARSLKRQMVDVRLDIRDYELAETKAEQLQLGKAAAKRLEAVRQGILAASQHNIFGAVDVAQLSAQIDLIMERL